MVDEREEDFAWIGHIMSKDTEARNSVVRVKTSSHFLLIRLEKQGGEEQARSLANYDSEWASPCHTGQPMNGFIPGRELVAFTI